MELSGRTRTSFFSGVTRAVVVGVLAAGCTVVVGTQDFEKCTDCGEGGGGAASASSTTGSSATSTTAANSSSSAAGGGCVAVTLLQEQGLGDVRVELDPDDVDFDDGETSHCLPAGTKTIRVECNPEDGARFPLDVDWGNPLCPRASSCTFELGAPQDFLLSGAACR